MKAALALQEKLTTESPDVPEYRQHLALCHTELGLLLSGAGKRTEAEERHRQALAIRERLAADFPDVHDYQVELGGSYCNIGNRVKNGGKPADSLAWYDKAITKLRPIHDADPLAQTARQFLLNSYGGRAQAYDRLKAFSEAVKDWDRVIELSPAEEQQRFRTIREASQRNADRQPARELAPPPRPGK